MKIKISSNDEINRLPVQENRYKVYFDKHFFVEVLPSGKKSYRIRYEKELKTLGSSMVDTSKRGS